MPGNSDSAIQHHDSESSHARLYLCEIWDSYEEKCRDCDLWLFEDEVCQTFVWENLRLHYQSRWVNYLLRWGLQFLRNFVVRTPDLTTPLPIIRRGADKTLARAGRKQATANKLGIYSTSSPRSSIHFLARCSNFCKPLKKKKNQNFVRPTRSPLQQWPPRRKKNGDLSIVFSVQGTGGSPMGPDPGTKDGWPRYWKQR